MRKTLNENPIFQIAALGVLAIVVGFLLFTRVLGSDSEESTASESATASDTAVAPEAPAETPAAPAPGAPSAAPSEFVAGPGLPRGVVSAYRDGRVVALLVTRHAGLDDRAVKAELALARRVGDLAVFHTNAKHITRYSRIASGVALDRVPALVVLRERALNDGGAPKASVSYGYRGIESVLQALREGSYKGPTNLPFYPK